MEPFWARVHLCSARASLMDQALPLQRRTWRRNSFEDRVMAESTQTRPGIDSELDRITELLREARARTIRLIEPLSDADLGMQHDPLMSPIVWDLGHIAHFEELWLNRNVHGTVE